MVDVGVWVLVRSRGGRRFEVDEGARGQPVDEAGEVADGGVQEGGFVLWYRRRRRRRISGCGCVERAVEEGEGCYGAVGVAGVSFVLGITGETAVVCLGGVVSTIRYS